MPTYEYHCDACNHQFDAFQMMSEEVLKKCPACGKRKLRRAFGTGAAILFKGSGFYETDYRSEAYQKAAKSDSEAPATPAADKASTADTSSTSSSTPASSEGSSSTKTPKSKA